MKEETAEITPVQVTQSGTEQNNETSFGAGNAVDKNLTTFSTSVVHNGEVWLKLEFDRSYFINRVVVHFVFYTNWYSDDTFDDTTELEGEEKFKRFVDSFNNVGVSVYQATLKRKSCGTLQLTYELKQSDQIYTINCRVEGDSVKLSKTSGRIFILEVVVLTLAGRYTAIYIKLPSFQFQPSFCRGNTRPARGSNSKLTLLSQRER